MMHETEKSDSAIVATKPANKAGQPAAEQVERRAGTGRNANQQSTCGTEPEKRVTGAGPRATSSNDMLPVAKYSR
jgi:RNA-directed DNA polymerase